VRSAIAEARLLRRGRADVLYVNTVTIPWWLVAGRLARVPAVLHVHEAEDDQGRLVATALNAPALLARTVLANSAAAARTMTRAVPRLEPRVTVVHNGVAAPPEAPRPREHVDGQPWQLALVGRLSPRKGTDVALEAVGQLVDRGHDVRLAVCGSVFPGYEWFEDELRARAGRPDLDGRVELRGYVAPTWPALAEADVVLVPSRTEPFGNTAVEAMLARRPVVASRVQGLAEVVTHERTGLLVEPGDPTVLAAAIERLLLDGTLRTQLADDAHREAHERFGVERYDSRVRELVRGVAK
jgi:glycosyltransferase involved in cell wall biosynthesis